MCASPDSKLPVCLPNHVWDGSSDHLSLLEAQALWPTPSMCSTRTYCCHAQAIGGSAGGDEAKQPETDFIRDDPQWLADAVPMTDDFMATPAVDHLVNGRLGAKNLRNPA